MTSTEVLEKPLHKDTAEDDMRHIVCICTPKIALCGADRSKVKRPPTKDLTAAECVVCLDLLFSPCPHCGDKFS